MFNGTSLIFFIANWSDSGQQQDRNQMQASIKEMTYMKLFVSDWALSSCESESQSNFPQKPSLFAFCTPHKWWKRRKQLGHVWSVRSGLLHWLPHKKSLSCCDNKVSEDGRRWVRSDDETDTANAGAGWDGVASSGGGVWFRTASNAIGRQPIKAWHSCRSCAMS